MKIIKRFGIHFYSDGGALTLPAEAVTEELMDSGTHQRTHASGWTIRGEVHEDWMVWVNSFEATHPVFGKVSGNFEEEVVADSEEGFADFYANHTPEAWDYRDI
jgi:hypothetical protein